MTLSGDGGTRTAKTNGFGDFEFEGLADNTKYTVKVAAPGYKAASCETKTPKTSTSARSC